MPHRQRRHAYLRQLRVPLQSQAGELQTLHDSRPTIALNQRLVLGLADGGLRELDVAVLTPHERRPTPLLRPAILRQASTTTGTWQGRGERDRSRSHQRPRSSVQREPQSPLTSGRDPPERSRSAGRSSCPTRQAARQLRRSLGPSGCSQRWATRWSSSGIVSTPVMRESASLDAERSSPPSVVTSASRVSDLSRTARGASFTSFRTVMCA